MSAWKKLYEHVRFLSEAKQYRGSSDIRLVDLNKLFMGDPPKRPGLTGRPADPNGGSINANYNFNPGIWKGWTDNKKQALVMAATDSTRVSNSGNAQGGTMHKTNWSGQVGNVAAPIRPHHNDKMGSTVDRYDVIMIGDILAPDKGVLTRIAWSPVIGSSEERMARLAGMLGGDAPTPLRRRPQGEIPAPGKNDPTPDELRGIAQDKQNKMKAAADAEEKENERRAKLGLPPLPSDTED